MEEDGGNCHNFARLNRMNASQAFSHAVEALRSEQRAQNKKKARREEAEARLWTDLTKRRQNVVPPTIRPPIGTRNTTSGLWFSVVNFT